MRIIAGIHRGRTLVTPKGLTTRPMTDRVRENLFNILSDLTEDAVVLDLFCGCGALGLEALSRGAVFCRFVDVDRRALLATRTNCERLGLGEKVRLGRNDALRPGPWIRPPGRLRYTLLFVDPPYKMTAEAAGRERLAAMAQALAGLGCVAPGATAMLRVERGTAMDRPWPDFETVDKRTYGHTTLYLTRYAAGRAGGEEGL